MQLNEHYELHTWHRGEDDVVEELFDMSEEEALTQYRATVRDQAKGTTVKLVRVMTVDIAISSK